MAANVCMIPVHDCEPHEVRQRGNGRTWWLQIGPVCVFLTPELLAAIHAATSEDVGDRE